MSNAVNSMDALTAKHCAQVISNCLFDIFHNWRSDKKKNKSENAITEEEAVAQCMLQMIVARTRSLLALSDGVSLSSKIEDIKLIDSIGMISVWRTMYEMVFMFHNIFIMPSFKEECKILFNIWQIRGYNNRQKCDSSNILLSKYNAQFNSEKIEISKLKKEVFQIIDTLNISQGAVEQIKMALKKESSMISGFLFKKENGKIISFEKISFEKSPSYLFKDGMDMLYTFLSMNSHASYLSVLQFGQLYNKNKEIHFLKTILTGVCFLASFFISDFCSYVKDAQSYYDMLSDQDKDMFDVFLSKKA